MESTGTPTADDLSLSLFDSSQVAIAVTRGTRHVLCYMNRAFRSTFGDPPYAPVDEAFPELRRRHRRHLFDRVYRTGDPETINAARLTRGEHDGAPRFVTYSLSPATLPDGGRGVLVVAVDVTEQVAGRQRLAEVSEERRLLKRYQSLIASSSQRVWVADPQGRVIERSPGWAETIGVPWQDFRGRGWLNCAHPEDREGLRTAWQRAVREVPDVFEHVFRLHYRDGSYRHCRLHATPVRERGVVVEWVSTCVDVEESWREERRRTLLTRAAAAIADTHQPEEAFAALAEVIVPVLADACSIFLLPEALETAPGPNRPSGRPLLVRRITIRAREGMPPGLPPRRPLHIPLDTAFARAVRRRQPEVAVFPPGDVPEDFSPPVSRPWLRRARVHAGVLLPVSLEGAVVAVVTAFIAENRPPPGDADMTLLRELVEQAHGPLLRALEFQRTQRVAWALQHSLLSEPPRVPGLELTARYLPSPAAAEIGGDWYDAFPLPGDRTALVIGDVTGHNIDAAVSMSQLRNMLRGLAADHPGERPGEVLRRLDAATHLTMPEEQHMTTCVYATVAAADDTEASLGSPRVLDYSVAGHLPPLLVTKDGDGRFLQAAHDLLLGGPDPVLPRESAAEPLPAGSTLLLYTDGLVERRDESIDQGLARLRDQATRLARAPLDLFCDSLVDQARGTESDDLALLALRVPR